MACYDRFNDKPLDLSARRDCVRLAAHAMRKMGVATPILKGLDYRSELGAAKALKQLGHADLVEAMDALGFVRIAPAMTWQADIVALPSRDSGPFRYGLSVVHTAGAGRLIGVLPNGRFGAFAPEMKLVTAAWRIG